MAESKKEPTPFPTDMPQKGVVYRHDELGAVRVMAHAREHASGVPRVVCQAVVSGDVWLVPPDAKAFRDVPARDGGAGPDPSPKAAKAKGK